MGPIGDYPDRELVNDFIDWAQEYVVFALQRLFLVAGNPNFEWSVVGDWFAEISILHGLEVTLGLTIVAMALGAVIGVLLTVAWMSSNHLLRGLAGLYIWLFRGTPLLVQLIFWYNIFTLFPRISLGLPFLPEFISWKTNDSKLAKSPCETMPMTRPCSTTGTWRNPPSSISRSASIAECCGGK